MRELECSSSKHATAHHLHARLRSHGRSSGNGRRRDSRSRLRDGAERASYRPSSAHREHWTASFSQYTRNRVRQFAVTQRRANHIERAERVELADSSGGASSAEQRSGRGNLNKAQTRVQNRDILNRENHHTTSLSASETSSSSSVSARAAPSTTSEPFASSLSRVTGSTFATGARATAGGCCSVLPDAASASAVS